MTIVLILCMIMGNSLEKPAIIAHPAYTDFFTNYTLQPSDGSGALCLMFNRIIFCGSVSVKHQQTDFLHLSVLSTYRKP